MIESFKGVDMLQIVGKMALVVDPIMKSRASITRVYLIEQMNRHVTSSIEWNPSGC